jgi:predicted nucleic acid-binding protein
MIFVDTWAWIALALKRDQNHRRVKALNKSFRRARRRYVTTDFVLSELIAHLYRTLTPAQAQGFINSLFAALEASDELMRRVLRGIHYVPILTPLGIDTLDFGLSRDKRKLLFDTGYRAAEEFLANFVPLQRVKLAGEQLQKQLMAEHGSPQYYVPVLAALAKEIERTTKALNVRAHIMLPTGRPEASRIVVYDYGMDGDNDADLELPEDAGCSGQAWTSRLAAFADLREARKNPRLWKMTDAQHRRVPDGQNSMLSVPIHRELNSGENAPPMPVGTLSVDTTTPLEDTGWITSLGEKTVAHPDVVTRIMQWAYIVHRLMS